MTTTRPTSLPAEDSAEPVMKRLAVSVHDWSGAKRDAVLVPLLTGRTVADVIREVQNRLPHHAHLVQELRLTTSCSTGPLLLHPADSVDGLLREMDELKAAPKGVDGGAPLMRMHDSDLQDGPATPQRSKRLVCRTPERAVQEPPAKALKLSPATFTAVKREMDDDDDSCPGADGSSGIRELAPFEEERLSAQAVHAREAGPVADFIEPKEEEETETESEAEPTLLVRQARSRATPCPPRDGSRAGGLNGGGGGGEEGGAQRRTLRQWWSQVGYPLLHQFANPQLLCVHRATYASYAS